MKGEKVKDTSIEIPAWKPFIKRPYHSYYTLYHHCHLWLYHRHASYHSITSSCMMSFHHRIYSMCVYSIQCTHSLLLHIYIMILAIVLYTIIMISMMGPLHSQKSNATCTTVRLAIHHLTRYTVRKVVVSLIRLHYIVVIYNYHIISCHVIDWFYKLSCMYNA